VEPDEDGNQFKTQRHEAQLKCIKNCQYYELEHQIRHFASKVQLSEAEKTVLKVKENTLQERYCIIQMLNTECYKTDARPTMIQDITYLIIYIVTCVRFPWLWR
jgi:hypothetical protein